MCIKNKAEVFFYHNVTANLSSGGCLSHSGILTCKTWTKQNQQFIKCCTRHSKIYKKRTSVDVSSGLCTGSRIFLK